MLLQLTEWSVSPPLDLSFEDRRTLEEYFQSKITSSAAAGQFQVQPGSVIGSVTIGDRTIVVQPKLRIDRVLFMTAYAADPYTWRDTWTTISSTHTLTDGMAAMFVTACERTLGQGLLRSYRTVDADEVTIKGRIRWKRQARRPVPLPMAVRYQLHDDDIVENQTIRAAASVLRRQRIAAPLVSAGLARIWQQLRHLTPAPITPDMIDRIVWTRHNVHYRPLIKLAQTILANTMADLASGSLPVTGFTLRLYDVFEQFVRAALREAVGATIDELPDNPATHGMTLDRNGKIKLEPDLALKTKQGWRFVGDVKYKRDTGSGHNPDLYQLLAYSMATGLPDATLIYADGPPAPTRHQIHNTEKLLLVQHLNLDQQPSAVLRDIGHIAASMGSR
jgi:5-methylcytosine-specific restriction enzyme subunit McrC